MAVNRSSNQIRSPMGEEIRLILVGKCGAGKSSLGNSLLQDKKFKVDKFSGTEKCEKAECSLTDENKLLIIDTPGFSSTDRTDEQTAYELRAGLQLTTPGPHLFALVISLRGRYSLEDLQLLEYIYQIHQSLYKYLIVVFTGFDTLQDDEISITEYIHKSPPEFRNFIEGKIGNKFEVINNKDKKNSEKFRNKIMELVRDTIESNQNTFVSCEPSSKLSSTCSPKTLYSNVVPSQNDFGFPNENDLNIVLLGKSGIGKSSLGNSLLGEKKFKTSMSENKGTTSCQRESKPMNGEYNLVIVDTPGFYRVTPAIPDNIDELFTLVDIIKPNVFILVLSVNERFTGDELESMKYVEAVFGPEVFKYMIVVFTWLDFLYDDDDDESVDIGQNIPQNARPLLSKCGKRFACINNKEQNMEEKKRHAQTILDMASTLVKQNKYSYYNKRIQPTTYKRVNDLEADRQKRIKGDGGRAIRDAVYQEYGIVSESSVSSRYREKKKHSWIKEFCHIL